MKLIAGSSLRGRAVGEAFEANGAEACRLITYGFATPAHPGPASGASSSLDGRQASDDAELATALRGKVRAKELHRLRRSSGD